MPAVSLRPQQPVPRRGQPRRVLVPHGVRGRAAAVPAGVRGELGVRPDPGLRQPEVHGPLPRLVRHQRPLPGHQPQPHLQLPRGPDWRPVQKLPGLAS